MYRYGSSSSLLSGNVAYESILILVITIAVIALTVIAYRKFVGKKADQSKPLSKFFNFDHLYLENITKLLYILTTVGVAGFCVYLPLAVLGSGISNIGLLLASFFGALIGAAILFVIWQFVSRMMFEWAMLIIRGAVDLHAIRKNVTGTDYASDDKLSGGVDELVSSLKAKKAEKAQAQAAAAPVAQAAPVAPAQAPAAAPVADQAAVTAPAAPVAPAAPAAPAADGTWSCQCGRTGNIGNFCAGCGSPRQ